MDKEAREALKLKNDRIHNLEVALKHYELQAGALSILAAHAVQDIRTYDQQNHAQLEAAAAICEKIQSITEAYR